MSDLNFKISPTIVMLSLSWQPAMVQQVHWSVESKEMGALPAHSPPTAQERPRLQLLRGTGIAPVSGAKAPGQESPTRPASGQSSQQDPAH